MRSRRCSTAQLEHVAAERLAHDRAAGHRRRHHDGVDRVRDRGRAAATGSCACATARRGRCSRRSYELKGHEEPKGTHRPKGVEHGADRDRVTWLEARMEEAETLGYSEQPEVVIVGGGQGAIGLGARLRQLGVPTIICERNERPGDSWRKRYKSLCLHDPVWYDHLPYIKFPENWPVFSPKDKIGDWLEMYTRVMELNYWGSTDRQVGDVRRRRRRAGSCRSSATARRSRCARSQLVLATGMSGKPNLPEITGMDVLQGRPAPLVQAPRPGRLRGQAGRRDRLQQLRPRHLRRAVGGRAPT